MRNYFFISHYSLLQAALWPQQMTCRSLSAKKDPWNYSQEIIIKENAGKILTDYPVPVVLNSSNFDFSKVKNDGSDIRFFSGDKSLDYWIETWDFKNNQAVIWVKIPFISAREDTEITCEIRKSRCQRWKQWERHI